jgi:hypothetical protein
MPNNVKPTAEPTAMFGFIPTEDLRYVERQLDLK